MELKNWIPDGYGIYFTYHIHHFDPIPSKNDTTKTMKINTTMVVVVSRILNMEAFKFVAFEGFISLGKLFVFNLILQKIQLCQQGNL